MKPANKIAVAIVISFPTMVAPVLAETYEELSEGLAKESQNPVSTLISVPFEYNYQPDVGPEEGDVHTLFIKPVVPTNLGKYNLINRFIIPVEHQQERFQDEGSQSGIGDITYQGFFSPASPGEVIWGLGPVITAPTHSNGRLGSDKWSGGPAAMILTMPGNWVVGALATHSWSFAGDSDADDINFSTLQYFVNYNLDNGWYLTSTPTMTANWEAGMSSRYFIPVGGGVGRLVRFGKQPVDFKFQAFDNVEKPKGAADWSMQFSVKFLFPK